jgi:cysteinyl-tRNA synthetase
MATIASMKIFDSLLEKKKNLPVKSKEIKLFVCGPTVYDKAHIGHARTYIAFDAFVRYLRYKGIKVFYLMNITDVDDKIIAKAQEKQKNPFEIARIFEKDFHKSEKLLNIKSVTKYARASAHIKEIIAQIKTLIKKGYAYQTQNGVYFQVKKFKDYGKLSKQNLETLRPGWRIDVDPQKKDPLDFALWKKAKINIPHLESQKQPIFLGFEPLWKSPWGWGRPGWHIEDTAITEKYFGVQYDIHGGASELKFPHHESEIAQQEAASGRKPLVKIWMHTGVLLVGGQKMSKSLKNFITIEDFVSKYGANALRFLVLEHSYRSPIDYTEEAALSAQKSINFLIKFLSKLDFVAKSQNKKLSSKPLPLKKFEKQIINSLEDDFNTPKALGIIFDLIKKVESSIYTLSAKELKNAADFIKKYLEILGFSFPKLPVKIPAKIAKLATQREKLRSNKQFIKADDLRKKINQLGYSLEDTPLGPFIYKN